MIIIITLIVRSNLKMLMVLVLLMKKSKAFSLEYLLNG